MFCFQPLTGFSGDTDCQFEKREEDIIIRETTDEREKVFDRLDRSVLYTS